ncbi:XamI family restriction endonuclease [Jatrophihabitans telluris]|uniref:XamI family restriction endonuclease n=2 Tax=Jatrophihabitans telluris TaxID=2038343 RepID=A0ABY4R316_9ACTN|nr:XamI family restriction endonuclease [Jatrophihabitans telluris]
MFRYVCAPPVSQEDFWTLVGGPKFRRVPAELADEAALALVDVVDPVRFPWVEQSRDPTPVELDASVLATTCLWAAQFLGTQQRSESSKRQEAAVGSALQEAGLTFDPSRSPAQFADAMTRGTYSRERLLAGAKCDVPARLHDGRLMAIECKVSNGPKNGWKRVNREVGGKAQTWRSAFGNQVLTAVVLDGVFDLASLKTARDGGVLVFWEYDLNPLKEFVVAAV